MKIVQRWLSLSDNKRHQALAPVSADSALLAEEWEVAVLDEPHRPAPDGVEGPVVDVVLAGGLDWEHARLRDYLARER